MNKKSNILVVDDNPAWSETLCEYLADITGNQPHTSESAEDAWKYLSTNTVDIVFTDTNMGLKSGIDLLKGIKADYPSIIVIVFFEGLKDSPMTKEDVLELKADYVLKKIETVKILPKILKELVLSDKL